jgi:type III restriction enzyme
MTNSGIILMVDAKGDHLDNDESKEKANIGSKWDTLTGSLWYSRPNN